MVKKRNRNNIVKIRDIVLLKEIEEIKSKHVYWGYRRIWSYLKYRKKKKFSINRIYRVMKENKLVCIKKKKLRAKRTKMKPKPKASCRNEIWGTDMTKIKTSMGWLYIHVVLDWYTKKIVGYYSSNTSKTTDWLKALHRGINEQFPNGYKGKAKELKLVSDNGCQPTSKSFMKACRDMDIKQIFTSFNNPKGNAETERVMRTLKEELIWPNDWENAFDSFKEIDRVMKNDHEDHPHSCLANRTPKEFDLLCLQKEKNYKSFA